MPKTVVLRQLLAGGIDDVTRGRGWGGVLGWRVSSIQGRQGWEGTAGMEGKEGTVSTRESEMDKMSEKATRRASSQTKSPKFPRSPMKHTPILSSRSAVGSPKWLASRRTHGFVRLARGKTACEKRQPACRQSVTRAFASSLPTRTFFS
jgi:hypothetical protein